jgi:hypothetical protein
MPRVRASGTSASSSTIESMPPDSATAIDAVGGT